MSNGNGNGDPNLILFKLETFVKDIVKEIADPLIEKFPIKYIIERIWH